MRVCLCVCVYVRARVCVVCVYMYVLYVCGVFDVCGGEKTAKIYVDFLSNFFSILNCPPVSNQTYDRVSAHDFPDLYVLCHRLEGIKCREIPAV